MDDRDELQLLASDVRALLISKTAEAGFHREAQRLALQGAAGFPDESNLALIGDMLGGSVALSVGDTYLVKGTGPVVMHIGFVAAVDGAGHQSGHFQHYQSYLPIRTRDEALVGDVTSPVGLALVREPPQTQTPAPLLCRQPSVARVPRSFSQEEDWLSKACRSGARTSSTALTQRYEDEDLGTVQDTRRLTRLVLRLQPKWEGRPNLVRLVVWLLLLSFTSEPAILPGIRRREVLAGAQ